MEKKVAIYLRKSRGVLEDLDKHKEQLISLCESKGYEYDIYSEIASSDTMDRKELNLMLDNIKKYKKIIVMAIDRLSRNDLHQALLTKILKDNDIELVTPNKTYNFTNETDIVTSDFEKLLARQEFRIIKGRLKTGKIHSFNKGNCITQAPFPYKYNPNTKSLDIVEEDYKKYRYIVSLAIKGLTPRAISEVVDMPAISIRRMLCNPVHRGFVKYAKQVVKGKHKPVLTEKEFLIIERYKNGRLCGVKKRKHTYSLSDLVKCTCGHTRGIKYRGDRRIPEAITKCQYCKDAGFTTQQLHQDIEDKIKEQIYSMNANEYYFQTKEEIKKKNIEFDLLEDKIRKLERKSKKIKDMILSEIFTIAEGKEKVQEIREQIQQEEKNKRIIIDEINRLSEENLDNINFNTVIDILKYDLNAKDKNNLYKTIINKIIVENKKLVKIEWK